VGREHLVNVIFADLVRYGFHGVSCVEFLKRERAKIVPRAIAFVAKLRQVLQRDLA
jgi:hypothetical protein